MRPVAVAAALLALSPLAACGGSPARPASIVLLLVDTLRADRLGAYGYRAHPTSPAFDRWVARGALCEHAFASSPWTLPSVATLFTGQHPSRHGAGRLPGEQSSRGVTRVDPSLPALAELLARRGYATAAIANNVLLDRRLGFARGFEHYDFFPSKGLEIRRADDITTRALRWLDGRDALRPFLLVVHYFDPHMAYDPAEAVRGRFTGGIAGFELPVTNPLRLTLAPERVGPEQRAFVAAAYDEEVAFVDTQLGRLLEGLAERGLLESALVVFTSDHGEELFDHGGFEHGHSGYQELLHVPLVFWGPGVREGRVDAPVSHADLLPTLLDAVGAPVPDGLAGVSLWPLLSERRAPAPRALVAEGVNHGPERRIWIRWPWKLILTRDGAGDAAAGGAQLFDLAADPGERRDLAAAESERLASLRRELEQHMAGDAPPRQETDVGPWRDHLRALGYVE